MAAKTIQVIMPMLVIAASLAAYAILHAAKPEPEKTDEGARPISVHTAPVAREDIRLRVVTQGEVRARTEIDLVAQVGGRVIAVSREFTEGGKIVPGVSLLKIEDTDYRLALRQAEARVAEAQVRLDQALADADVARKQLRNDPNPSRLALRKPQVAEAQARIKAAEADLEQAQLGLDRTDITLPFAGRLMETRVDIGQFIVPGTVLARAFATDIVEVRLPLDNSQLASLGLPIGYAAEDQGLPVTLSAAVAGQPQQWQGRLVRLDASIDPDTRMLYAMVEVESPYERNVSANGMPLAVGLYVEATILGRELSDAYTVPSDALRAGNVVFLINADGRLDIKPVEVVHHSPTRAVISGGVAAGDQVITSPVRNPIKGMALVAIQPHTEPAQAAR
jgi:RND family efflux transporter MFP subunit